MNEKFGQWGLPRRTQARFLIVAAMLAVGVAASRGAVAGSAPIHATAPPLAGAVDAVCSSSNQAPVAGNLVYGNGPVMVTVTAYTIYWSPNSTISASYRNLVNRYFQDVNGSAFYNINTQYFQNPGSVPMQNVSAFGGTWLDTTNAYPGGRGTPASPLTGQDLKDEINRALTANPSWGPPDGTRLYFVYTEQGIESCADTFSGCTPGVTSPPAGAGSYCAYHDHYTDGGGHLVIWANMPYAYTWSSCQGFTCSPNGDIAADTVISPTSHEHFEAATDPLWDGPNGWTGPGFENGDKCAYNYGTLQNDGHNMVLNGNPYIIQREWSNADSGCVTRYDADVDLAVDKSDQADPVTTGSNVVWDLSIENTNGTYEGSDLSLTDTLPAGTTFVSLTAPAGWACATPAVGGTGTITCTRISLAANATAAFTLSAKLSCSMAGGAVITNTSSVTSTSDDPNSANDTASEHTTANNPPPSITCPAGISVECTGNCGTPASNPALAPFFSGVSATDNCGVTGIVNNAPSFFNLGTTPVTFTATDTGGATASCQANVTVVDTIPPTISVTLSRYMLWPPNHKLADIAAGVTVTDVCDPHPTFVLTSITSNEPDNGTGDGDTANDIQYASYGTADTQFKLRSERSGTGRGRVYTIVYTASDKSGNKTPATVRVYVPHDQSGQALSGPGFNALGTGLQAKAKTFELTVTSTPDFDATRATSLQVGNTVGTIEPLSTRKADVNCDELPDLIVSYSSAAANELQSRSAPDDPLAFRYASENKDGYLVPNIFGLGGPSSTIACVQ